MKNYFSIMLVFFSINRFNTIFIHLTIQNSNIHSDFEATGGVFCLMDRRNTNHLAGISCAVLCNITIIHCFSTQNSFRFKLEKKAQKISVLVSAYLALNAMLPYSFI